MGRITGYTSPEGAVSYTYDANSNVLTVNDSHGTITRTYDALNRVLSYTDTYGKVIRYEYDAVGNLSKLIYPDNTAVTYAYDANHNLVRVTDWANRVTAYTYDVNNRVVGVTKPDGSVTTTVYDNKQRVTSTVERTAGGVVITGFEYTYDDMSRIVEEKVLANNTKMCYTYDNLSRVTRRTVVNLSDNSQSEETFSYDAAGNITDASDSCFQYDTNNRLSVFNGNSVSYDLDGNMLSNGSLTCAYDSANRLVSAGDHTYTYNAEDVRIRNLCECEDTTYVYDTNCELSQLLTKTTNNVTTKYVYGLGLVGEETNSSFKIYHFDYRGSTIAITDIYGNITDTFAYDTYGKCTSHFGSGDVIFGYNGRDGVVTDYNGLIYMRARYYSPDMRRFVNADIIHGEISDSTSLNRYAYVNGNPISFVDPFGLMSVWAKVLVGAVVITGLAVATAVTGGAAAAVLGAALVGATVSGAASAVSSAASGASIDEVATSFMVGTISGAASGVLAASGAGAVGMVAWGAVIDAGEVVLEDAFNGKLSLETVVDATISAGVGVAIDGLTDIRIGKTSKYSKPVRYEPDYGWNHKNGDLYPYRSKVESTKARHLSQENNDYYKRTYVRAEKEYNLAIKTKHLEYAFECGIGEFRQYYIDDPIENFTKKTINNIRRK